LVNPHFDFIAQPCLSHDAGHLAPFWNSNGGESMAIEVLRGGETASRWSGNGWGARLGTVKSGKVSVRFKMASKGGGTSDVLVKIDHENFEELAKAMMRANSKGAIKAFGVALQEGFS
jgi:hypothetical protein